MQLKFPFLAALGVTAAVSACTPPPPPIMAEPIFNKVGEPTGQCTNGYVFDRQQQLCEPPTGCTPNGQGILSHVEGLTCPPPQRQGGDNGGNNGGNQPLGNNLTQG